MWTFGKDRIVFDKTICSRFSVLELSKLLWYEFHYRILKPYWKQNKQLHYMDIDRFVPTFDTDEESLKKFYI